MSDRGRQFIDHWVSEHIDAGPYHPDGDNSEAQEKADDLIAVAQVQGVSRSEIEEEVGDLVDYLSGAMESATDAEVARLVAKKD
jgi:hypothetical protein